jgi:multidrug efflux pump subunit AcrA (membrane-fusion protein)
MDRLKKYFIWIAVAVAILGAGAWAWRLLSSQQKVNPKVGPMVESVYGIGTVTARHTFQLKLGVADTLRKIYVQEGDTVKRGQKLVAFTDNAPAEAPFDGVITSLPYKEGESVFPQFPILTLTDLKDPYVVVSLEQSGAIPVRKGQTALLSFEALRGQKLSGTVSAIYPKDGEFYVNIEVPGLPVGILVGMTCDVAIEVARKEKVLQIPMVAVDKGMVTVLRSGIPQKVPVKLGVTDGTWAEVADNSIQPGDTLLISGKK